MPTIEPIHKDEPGRKGLFFRIRVEPGQRALAVFELLADRMEVDRKYIDCADGDRDLAVEEIFSNQDLSRSGLELTYTIGPGGLVRL